MALAAATALLAALAIAPPAAAGDRFRLGVRAGGFDPINAQDSYDQVYGDTVLQFGVQLEVHTPRRLFFAASFDYGTVDGELAAPPPTPPQGISTELTLSPLHLTAAWLLRPRDEPWNVYLGAGPSVLFWEEKVNFAGQGLDGTSSSDFGGSAVAGLRRELGRFSLSGELRWSTFPGSLDSSVNPSGEDDLGGLSLHLAGLWRL